LEIQYDGNRKGFEMKKYLVLFMATILMASVITSLIPNIVDSQVITELGNPGNPIENTIILDGSVPPLLNATTYLDLPIGMNNILPDSYFTISPVDTGDGKFAFDPTVDVGVDGDIEWTYQGTGYGDFGYQSLFSDDFSKKTLKYTVPGINTATSIKLPRDARVVDAKMNIEGRLSTPTFQSSSLELDTGFDQASYIGIGDIDNDGNDDVVASARNTVSSKPDLAWYKNPGPPGGADWTKTVITTNINYAHRVKVADLDNDGDQDVVISTYSSSTGVWWFENKNSNGDPGKGTAWIGGDSAHRIDNSNKVQYPYTIEVGDLDGDDDIDVVVASNYWNSRDIYGFENKDPKNATTWVRNTILKDASSYVGGIAIGNINHKQPGRMEIVYTTDTWGGKVCWLENDGTPFTGTWTSHNIYDPNVREYYPQQVAIGDLDNDNRDDVVVVKRYTYGTVWYKNPTDPPSATKWARRTVGTQTYYPTDVAVGYLDNDTYMDIVTTSNYQWNNNYKLHYYKNPGTTSTWPHKVIDASLSGITGIGVSNLDVSEGDSDLDIIAAGYDAGEVKWYKNKGGADPSFDSYPVDDSGISNPNDVEVIDVDDDGDNDFIVTGAKSGDVQWFETPDDPLQTTWNIYNIDSSTGQAWEVAIGDIDMDGDFDLAVTSHTGNTWNPTSAGKVVWFEHPDTNVKAVNSWKKHIVDDKIFSPYGVDIGDIDGDGDNDIVVAAEEESKIYYYRNTDGNGTFNNVNDKFELQTGVSYAAPLKLVDLDMDNDLDVVSASGTDSWWSGSAGIVWLENPSNPAVIKWPKHTINKNTRSVKDIAIADIDDNNYPDIIATTSSNNNQNEQMGVHWYENPGKSAQSWNPHTIRSDGNFGGFSLHVSDIGNDGYLDIIAGSGYTNSWGWDVGYHKVFWFEEPDEPLQASSWETYDVSNLNSPRGVFIGDLDGKNLKDIVTLGAGLNEIKWHRVSMFYPEDVTLNIAGAGEVDFNYPGEVNKPRTTPNLALTFKEVLSDAGTPYDVDQYGNEISEIFLEVKCPVIGRVGINSVEILYQYDAKVEINPHNHFLFNELNEIIPDEGEGTIPVNIGVTSKTPSTLRIANVLVNYNSPPTLEKEIPSDRHVKEGDSVNYLFNLHNYFSDDIDKPENLLFRVEKNNQADKVWVFITDMKFLKVSATRDDDWSGTLDIQVSATDTFGAKTYSNDFVITIDNTNDEPLIGVAIPDFEIYEGQTTLLMDMDIDNYFVDIDSEKLYYRALVDESFRNYLRIDFDYENNMYATAIGDRYDTNIPVHIYCDDKDLTGLAPDELQASEIVQDIFIDILNVNDGPMWLNFPAELEIEEDYTITNGKEYKWLNLNDFSYDIDNREIDRSYSVVKNTNSSYFDVRIDNQDWLYIDNSLVENYVGQTFVTIRMTDQERFADISFWIKTVSINDKPSITIISPDDYTVVSGEIRITGSAQDIESLQKVMVRINDGEWLKITGTNSWEFEWITSDLADGDYLLSFKAYDGDSHNQKVSDAVQLHLVVKNVDNDPDNDGYSGDDDKFSLEPSQWADTDADGYGDNPNGYNADLFPEDPTEWFDDDGDGYGNNIDKFEYDPTQWNDTDDDGFGDNNWGNYPDLNIMDSSVGSSVIEEKADPSDENVALNILWYIILAIVIANIVITYIFNRLYKPPSPD
jgi:hypothetical protein